MYRAFLRFKSQVNRNVWLQKTEISCTINGDFEKERTETDRTLRHRALIQI